MSISKKDLQLLLEDQSLQDSFHQLSYIEDHYGFNYIPSTRNNIIGGVSLICLRRAWRPIQARVEKVYPEIFYFFLQHTNIFDEQKVEIGFKEVIRVITLKVDHFKILCDIILRAIAIYENKPFCDRGRHISSSSIVLADVIEVAENLAQTIE